MLKSVTKESIFDEHDVIDVIRIKRSVERQRLKVLIKRSFINQLKLFRGSDL